MRFIRRRGGVVALILVATMLSAGPAVAAPRGLSPGTHQARTVENSVADKRLDAALDAVTVAGMPGVLGRVTDGPDRWKGASGVADIHTKRPMRPHMRFRIGSITKTFVATVVLQHVSEGRLDLDAPVADYLPGLLPDDLGESVTVRMLLNHTSGLPDYDTVLYREITDIEKYRLAFFTPRQLVKLALTDPPTPRGQFAYSNTNYILAGMIVERVSGRSIQSEVTRRIIRPLRLKDTSFPRVSPFIPGPHPASYVPAGPPERPLVDFSVYTPTVFGAAGAMISSTRDLERFFDELLFGNLLDKDALAEMQTTVPTGSDAFEYGLGLMKLELCGTFWGHDGVVWGQTALALAKADTGRHVSVATTMSHYGPAGEPIDQALSNFLLLASCPDVTVSADEPPAIWPGGTPRWAPLPSLTQPSNRR
ncbi:serine hydrolase domain-containing protein [Thermasporomyces composti]|jgi:D-alanyl-D-alanine carboxypeptidase|uniref:D-alanyl-D-alanine carboxypeptidase n=1 Tax=Thermasporomyces composti TaxID=696763 RepID=A0A3D9VBE9_THECX|nr:serine hydrolase domain-containing protein [Thermasporomyces composti]REF35484.1 D-alanyl-D-alanine carboxypeptidase [Thermasporomyces composti]